MEAPSYDGTMVPLSIIHRKDLKLDGSTPAILDGYGAYGISFPPAFDVRFSVALHDVVLGYCHVRGGGEKGEDWYKAGYKATKPNTWKDFIACAEYLTKNGYTTPSKLAARARARAAFSSVAPSPSGRISLPRPSAMSAWPTPCAGNSAPNGPVNVPEFGTVKDPVEVKAWPKWTACCTFSPG